MTDTIANTSRYVIQSTADSADYWSNETGFGCLAGADVFDAPDVAALNLPIGGRWAPLKSYSVLLLYPDYANDSGLETYYAFVEAPDATEAVAEAQRKASAAQIVDIDDPTDFAPLLVTQGHHRGEPLFNK